MHRIYLNKFNSKISHIHDAHNIISASFNLFYGL